MAAKSDVVVTTVSGAAAAGLASAVNTTIGSSHLITILLLGSLLAH
jgi:hypothetical protein